MDPLGLSCVPGDCPGAITIGQSAEDFGKVEGTYSAITPGPLPDNIAETFTGGRCSEVALDKDTVLYRAGTVDKPLEQYFSNETPKSTL